MRFNLIDQVILCCSLEGILGGYCLSNADVDFVPCAASHLNILWLSSTFTIDYTTVFRLYCDTWTFSPFSVHLWGVITPLCSPQWTGLEHKHLFLSHNVILYRFKNSVMRSKDPSSSTHRVTRRYRSGDGHKTFMKFGKSERVRPYPCHFPTPSQN